MQHNPWKLLVSCLLSTGLTWTAFGSIATAEPLRVPMEISTAEGEFTMIVPDRDPRQTPYGDRLTAYDLHVAKMIEVTHYMCSSGRLSPSTTWRYLGDKANLGSRIFPISCQLAADTAQTYGLGSAETTPIYLSYEEAGGETKSFEIRTLNIQGNKVEQWLQFIDTLLTK